MADALPRRGPIRSAGVLLGIGLGGLFNQLLLHDVMYWSGLAVEIAPSRLAVAWDGGLRLLMWVASVLGVLRLWRAGMRTDVVWSNNVFMGGLALGWGGITLGEGLINHQLLGLHHVRPGPHYLFWDLGFLALGAVLTAVGIALWRASRASEWQGPITRPQEA